MKKQYIKLPTLAEAYALAEANGYKREEGWDYDYEDGSIVKCLIDGDYYPSSYSEDECIEAGYTKLEGAKQVLQVGEMVWVDDYSEANARRDKEERELLAILPEDMNRRYVCRRELHNGSATCWKYAVSVEKEEEKEAWILNTYLTPSEKKKVEEFISSLRA